ncbi:GNAT family N-acetyltransferase [Couchioplanes caeruleus]|uniref:GNAT family N-acetyltransferase n=2 Tax=Couchioplanes caeruleus TaxID=56438 RepID=A0A1K0FTI3_9ACTN|nr:GNAT family N-acetyltransferase [Couchioplanes caeruleus]OJF16097.1 GNAT family N-acetyltransferase [Couchioplanes caeruleus subsp. caeruleus]ROP29997.1 RimJ/RimL family protein N-acetyltransferase [Couchioplanes caeruleus]
MIVPAIPCDGVRLRVLRPEDLDDLLACYNDPDMRRFTTVLPVPFTREHADEYIHDLAPRMFAAGGGLYAVADPVTDRLLGGVGIDRLQPGRAQAEIGYWTGTWARRRGVATAAVRALAGHAFDTGLARLELLTHRENAASQRVALAAGFRPEGVRRAALPGHDDARDDALAYARLADDPPGPVERLLPDLPGGELTDGVVTLRPLAGSDLAFYAELHSQEDVVATTVPPVPPSPEEMRRRCAWSASRWLAGDRADLVIVDTATGTPTGEIGLYYQEPGTGQAMIGYSMLAAWRGRGYPTRAAQLLSLWAFAETGIARLIAGALPTNVGSQRVLEKAGFKREAYLRSRLPGAGGRRSDDVQFALLAEDLLTEGPRLDG